MAVPHLAGQDVHAWTDQGQLGPFTVGVTGDVDLGLDVTHAIVGLFDETHEFETLDIQAPAPDGSSLGRRKRIHQGAGLKVHRTVDGRVRTVSRDMGASERTNGAMPIVKRPVASDRLDAFSGTTHIEVTCGYADEVALRFTPEGGAPMTVTAMNIPVEEEGA